VQLCQKKNYQYWFRYDSDGVLHIGVAGLESERMAKVQALLLSLDDDIERLKAGKDQHLSFSIHPLDFRWRTLITQSPRGLKGPTKALYQGLAKRGLRLKTIHNYFGIDRLVAYRRSGWW
jgi:hypothetical protein